MIGKHLKSYTWKEVLGICVVAAILTVFLFVGGTDSDGNLTGFPGHLYMILFAILVFAIGQKVLRLTVHTGLKESGKSIVVFYTLFATIYVIVLFFSLFLRPPFLLFYPLVWLQMLGVYLYAIGVLTFPVISIMKRQNITEDTLESQKEISFSDGAPLLVLFVVGAILLFFSWGFLLFIITGILGIIAQIFLWKKA